ncbi:Sec-independent protein translocase protein TatB [Rheinheimera sp.]|uniref:Sec-independent protein translocase protein TatB n=1 Tax=Rheinheimera sp. TaxID=1869214 RepID=UPI003AF5291A
MSFWELVVIAIVALLVLGPERLPGAIRSVSEFIRGVKQFGQQMQAELNDELRVQELHEKLKQAEEKGLLNLNSEEMKAIAELRQAAADVTNPYPTAAAQAPTAPATPAVDATGESAPSAPTTSGYEQHKPQ